MLIDTSQMQCFLAVAKSLNFTKAANELYISQPVISRKILSMEKELGITLFERSKRSISLTKEGEKFKNFFENYFSEINQLMKEIELERNSENGRITIGIFEGWDLTEFLHSIAYDFHIQYQNIEVFFDSGTPIQLQEGLYNGSYDAVIMLQVTANALIQNGCMKETDIMIDHLLQVEKCIVFSNNNPLAHKETLTLEDFKNQTFFCLENDQVSYPVITNQKLFDSLGYQPKMKMMKSVDAVSTALLTGMGYAIMDDATKIFNYQGIRHVMLGERHIVSLVVLKGHKQCTQILRNYLKNKYTID